MKRVIASLVILGGTLQIAIASGVPEKVEEMLPEPAPEPTGTAAVAGRFAERPPTEFSYPVPILLKMRRALDGEDPAPEAAESDGH